MGPDERTLLRTLILGERLLALGVVVEGAPVVGVVPFAPAPDVGGV